MSAIVALLALFCMAGCERPVSTVDGGVDAATPSPNATHAPASAAPGGTGAAKSPEPQPAAAIAHGGVGSPPERADGCRRAVDAALAKLAEKNDPLAAVVAGVKVLEDDPRFNAGTGSRVRIDGETVQMDAAVMDSGGRFGAVAVIEKVRHPVVVARAVMGTPHLLLAGDGATRFARSLGMPLYDPTTPEMRAATKEIQKRLQSAQPGLSIDWATFDWRARWNFAKTLKEAGLTEKVGSDTVGVAVRTANGRYAVALSTGGTAITLRGRVGDVPILGAGLFAGSHGAVAATGKGERIVEAGLSRWVHEQMAAGKDVEQAAERGVARIRGNGSIGLIVIGADRMVAVADRKMAWAGREQGSKSWLGPQPSK